MSRVGLGQARAILVNAIDHQDAHNTGYKQVAAIREACRAIGLSFKVFNPGNAYWEDYGPNGSIPGIKSWILSGGSGGARLLYINAHGHHWVHEEGPRIWGTSFGVQVAPPNPRTPLSDRAWASITKGYLDTLRIPRTKYRLVWIDACGSGRRNAGLYANLEHPHSWRYVNNTYTNDLASGFGLPNPEAYPEKACYYMGYYGTAYINRNYLRMVQLFFQKFSENLGQSWTVGQVMSSLSTEPDVINEFDGPPFVAADEQGYVWLRKSPPYYNIRVFTNNWYGTGPNYDGLEMADLKR